MSDVYPVQRLCEVFSVSRSGYYTWLKGGALALSAARSGTAGPDRGRPRQVERHLWKPPGCSWICKTRANERSRAPCGPPHAHVACAAARSGATGGGYDGQQAANELNRAKQMAAIQRLRGLDRGLVT